MERTQAITPVPTRRSLPRVPARRMRAATAAVASVLALALTVMPGSRAEAAWNAFPRVAEGADPAEPGVELDLEQRVFVGYHLGVQTTILQPHFRGRVDDFGIVIPVPALPDFSATVDPEFFDQLIGLTGPLPSAAMEAGYTPPPMEGARGDDVTVVESAEFDIYRARVLEASSLRALTDWLDENGFRWNADAAVVFEDYIRRGGWYFIALEANTVRVEGSDEWNGYMKPIVIRYAIDQITLPMRIAYLQADKLINWTLFLNTAVGVQPPPGAEADFSEKLDDAALQPFAGLGPVVLPGDVVQRLRIPLHSAQASDFFLQLVTVDPDATPGVEDGGGCTVARSGAPRSGAPGAAGLLGALLALVGASLVARRRRR